MGGITEEEISMFQYLREAPITRIKVEGDEVKIEEGVCVVRTKLFGVDVAVVLRMSEQGEGQPLAILCNAGVFGMLDVPAVDDEVIGEEGG